MNGDANAPSWSLQKPALLEIAANRAEGWYLNDVHGALRRSDGGVVVANSGEQQLLFFGPSGALVGRVGREGAGPGEFERLYAIWPEKGDTVAAYDADLRRVTLATPAGFTRTVPVNVPPTAGFIVVAVGAFNDGGVLAFTQLSPADEPPPGLGNTVLELFRSDDTTATTLGRFRGPQLYTGHVQGYGGQIFLYGAAPFGTWTRFRVASDTLWIFDNADYAFSARPPEGRRLVDYRGDWTPRKVTPALRERHIDLWARESSREETWQPRRRTFETVQYPETMAAYRNALVGRGSGLVWLEPYEWWDGIEQHWVAYDRRGRARGRLSVPYGMGILEIGTDYLLAKESRQDGSEVVRLYSIRKN